MRKIIKMKIFEKLHRCIERIIKHIDDKIDLCLKFLSRVKDVYKSTFAKVQYTEDGIQKNDEYFDKKLEELTNELNIKNLTQDAKYAYNEFLSNIRNSIPFIISGKIIHSKNAFPDAYLIPKIQFLGNKNYHKYRCVLDTKGINIFADRLRLFKELCSNLFIKMLKNLKTDGVELSSNDIINYLTIEDLVNCLNYVDDLYKYRISTEKERVEINELNNRELMYTGYGDKYNFPMFDIKHKNQSSSLFDYIDYYNIDPKKEYVINTCHYIIAEPIYKENKRKIK